MPSQLIPILKDYLKTLYKPKPSTRLIPHTKYIFEHTMKKYSKVAGVKNKDTSKLLTFCILIFIFLENYLTISKSILTRGFSLLLKIIDLFFLFLVLFYSLTLKTLFLILFLHYQLLFPNVHIKS